MGGGLTGIASCGGGLSENGSRDGGEGARVCVCVGGGVGVSGVVVLIVVTVSAGGVGAVFVVVVRACVVVPFDVDVEAVMLLGALNFVGTVGSSWRLLLDT